MIVSCVEPHCAPADYRQLCGGEVEPVVQRIDGAAHSFQAAAPAEHGGAGPVVDYQPGSVDRHLFMIDADEGESHSIHTTGEIPSRVLISWDGRPGENCQPTSSAKVWLMTQHSQAGSKRSTDVS